MSARSNSTTTRKQLLPSIEADWRGFSRRGFLKTAAIAALATAGTVTVTETRAGDSSLKLKPHSRDLTDTNVTLGRWPFRRLPLDDTTALSAKLHRHGVTQAWASSFEGLWHQDIAGVNDRLTEECRRHGRGLFAAFGSVNPKLPDWEEDLRRCHERRKMPGIRLCPNYHGYRLDEPVFARLLSLASKCGLIVQIAASMEDERMQSAPGRVPDVDLSPLPALVTTPSAPRIVLLNWYRAVKGDLLKKLADTGKVCFDIAMVEGVGGVANLMSQVPLESVLFGSHAPFFYFESALLKLKESSLNDEPMRLICSKNARRVWSRP